MDCAICFDKKDKYLKCVTCSNIFCGDCQISWGKPLCMECKMEFTRQQLIELFTKKVLDKSSIGTYWKDIYFNREQTNFIMAQEFIKWEEEQEANRKLKRFGIYKQGISLEELMASFETNETSSTNPSSFSIFQCGDSACLGTVYNGSCGICNKLYCNVCHELTKAGHVCDVQVLETLKTIMKDSKKCPSCGCLIFRSSGCAHMRCTNCGIYFNWETLVVSKHNSNPILDSELITNSEDDITHLCQQYITDYAIVKYTYKTLYKSDQLQKTYRKQLLDQRVKYIKKQITKEKFIDSVYAIEIKYNGIINKSNILKKYFKHLQASQEVDPTYLEQLNSELNDIYTYYGGRKLQFRVELTDAPPLIE